MSSTPPESLTDPSTRSVPTGPLAIISRVGQGRLRLALFIVGFGTIFANTALNNVLLAAKLAILAPEQKVALLGLATAIAGLVSGISIFVWGTVSDRIRSRFGKRSPLIVLGGIGAAIFIALVGLAPNAELLIAAYVGYNIFLPALSAAVLAVFPDRVPREKRGTASAFYGGAQVFAGAVAGIVASNFISAPNLLLVITSIGILVPAVAFVLIAPDFSNRHEPIEKLTAREVLTAFKLPKGAPDFYWAFTGRFVIFLGASMIVAFQLYILTDHYHLANESAGRIIAVTGIATLLTIVVSTVVAGPLSDKIGRRRMPIFIASLILTVAPASLLFIPTGDAVIAYGALYGLGTGMFLSVDAALMTEVLPDQLSRGKDLGFLNLANYVPNVIGPLVTSLLVSTGLGYTPVFVISIGLTLLGAFSIFKIKGVR
ncbi:MFS transporter [Paenarthrobacter sp. NPDC058040]|uniref:MFS transporter n=1 Tax=unclassified Paenarthrobacter TaxID=2634190 RepID=UPI0036D97D03